MKVTKTNNEVEKTVKINRPLVPLNAKANKLYKSLIAELEKEGSFMERDYLLISQLCKIIELYIEATERIRSIDDCVEEYKNGSNVSGLFTVWNRLQEKMIQIYPQIGIGMKARQRMTQYINNQLSLFENYDPWQAHADEIVTIDV